jgi:hypothetical protein
MLINHGKAGRRALVLDCLKSRDRNELTYSPVFRISLSLGLSLALDLLKMFLPLSMPFRFSF